MSRFRALARALARPEAGDPRVRCSGHAHSGVPRTGDTVVSCRWAHEEASCVFSRTLLLLCLKVPSFDILIRLKCTDITLGLTQVPFVFC